MRLPSQFQRNSSRTIAPLILLVLAIASIFIRALAETPIRMILGMTLVLFLPGYSLVPILFPPKIRLSRIEYVGTTIFLSITIVSFIGVILNRSPYGIRLVSVLICVSGFVLSVSMIAHLLKHRTQDLIESADAYESIHDGEGDCGVTSFLQKHYEVFGLFLACVLIFILNTLPYFGGKILLDQDEWLHLAQVDYVLNNGHTINYTIDRDIMVQPNQYPPVFHAFFAILIQFTNFPTMFVFKWIITAIFGPFLVLAIYLMISQFAGKKKALVTSLILATWMSEGGVHGPLWRIPSTISIGFFMFCLYSLAKYYDTQESSFLVTGGMALGLVLLSHMISGPILVISLSCFLFLRILSHRTITKEDVYLLSMMGVTAVIVVILYWFSALQFRVPYAVGLWWGVSWGYTNWFDLSYLFLRIPLLLAPFGLISILRTHKRVESLLLTSCFIVGFFFSFSYFMGVYIVNKRFALYWTLISYVLSGLGLFEVSRFILNLRPNIRISLIVLSTACYALFRLIYPFSNHPMYVTYKAAYDLYANVILVALILTLIAFITLRTFENPDRLVAFFAILIVIGSSLSTAIFTYYYEPPMSENEYLANLWMKESHEPDTIVVYETLEKAWFNAVSEVNVPISRLYGETNYSQRAIERNDILTNPDTNLTIELLQVYHITYIFTYNGSSVSQKYQSLTTHFPHYFRIAYQNEEIVIYEFLG